MLYPLLLKTLGSVSFPKSSCTTIFPAGRNQLEISTAASKYPPGFPRRSIINLSDFDKTNSLNAFLKSFSTPAEKLNSEITNIPSFLFSYSKVGILILSRTTLIESDPFSPSLASTNSTVVPFSPRINPTASSTDISEVTFPSICKIISPALIPAFSAGVSLIGEITTRIESFSPTSIPTPEKLPLILSLKALFCSGTKNLE